MRSRQDPVLCNEDAGRGEATAAVRAVNLADTVVRSSVGQIDIGVVSCATDNNCRRRPRKRNSAHHGDHEQK